MRFSGFTGHGLRMWFVAAAVLITGWLTAPAAAQGTMGTVPDPISARELETYANRLDLSRPQRQALETLHDQYKQEYAQLRETDIEKFMNESRNMGGGGMAMLFDRDATKKAFRQLEDITNKVKTIDNRMFDQIQGMLTEDQVNRMAQVRQARERIRYRSGLSRLTAMMNPAAQVDLSEFTADLKLSPQEADLADPIMVQYESSLTSGARKLHDSTSTLVMEGLDRLQAEGVTPESARDPGRGGRDRMFQTVRTIMSEIQLKLADKAGEISELNRRTVRSLSPVLAPEHNRSLRDQFYQRAYPEIRGNSQTARSFDIVLKLNDLTDEQRQTIAALQSEYNGSYDRLMEQAMDTIDTNRKSQTFFDMDRESRRASEEKLTEVREKRTKLNETSLTSLKAALLPEQVAALDKRLANGGKDPEEATVTVTGMGPGGGTFVATRVAAPADASQTIAIDPYIPSAISTRDIETYGKRLNLSSEQQSILAGLHGDYMEKFRAIENDQIKAVRTAERSQWGMDGGQVSAPAPAAVEGLFAARQKALSAILALDQEFFNDVQVAVIGDENTARLDSVKNARLRDIYSRAGSQGGMFSFGATGGAWRDRGRGPGGGGPGGPGGGRAMRYFGGGESAEASIDLSALVHALEPTPTDNAQFQSALGDYEVSAVAAFQKMYETSMKMQLARDRMMAQMAGTRQGGGPPGAGNDGQRRGEQMGDMFRTLQENEGKQATEARRAVATLNKTTLTKLTGTLSPTDAAELRRTFNQKAYPGVYRDPNAAQPHIKAALNLQDLSEQQRSAIQEISLEYTGQYEELCDKLIALESNSAEPGFPGAPGGGGAGGSGPQNRDGQNFMEQMRTREKIEFDRNDLNDRTMVKLRGTLTEQQLQSLGGLQTTSG